MEVLYGSEVNLLAGGRLSPDERYLRRLDYAIAGIHILCCENEGAAKNTENLPRCLAHPKVRFVTHPDDDRYPVDYPALVAGARALHTALELNNSSLRKETFRHNCAENYKAMLPLCREAGVPVLVNTDAHDPDAVGDFALARALLAELGFDEALSLNTDPERPKAFLPGT